MFVVSPEHGLIHFKEGMEIVEELCPGGPGPRHAFAVLSGLERRDARIAEGGHVSRQAFDALFIAPSLKAIGYMWHAGTFGPIAWQYMARGKDFHPYPYLGALKT
jgi:hypothetical protein